MNTVSLSPRHRATRGLDTVEDLLAVNTTPAW